MTQAPVEDGSREAATLPPNWKPDTSAFGARLALIRWQLNYNQKEAALVCGVPPASWRAWEVDGSMPRDLVAVASQVAERTGCNRMWLMVGDEVGAS